MEDDQKESPLTDAERRELRELLERDRRATWAWSTARVWSTWIVAVIAMMTVGLDFLKRIVKTLSE